MATSLLSIHVGTILKRLEKEPRAGAANEAKKNGRNRETFWCGDCQGDVNDDLSCLGRLNFLGK